MRQFDEHHRVWTLFRNDSKPNTTTILGFDLLLVHINLWFTNKISGGLQLLRIDFATAIGVEQVKGLEVERELTELREPWFGVAKKPSSMATEY